jgi:DNA-binding winged helix-turn-helix (wHTH) protein/tetratricopeptide (TPR) repeat protein
MVASAPRFGPFVLDRSGYRLLRGTEAIRLSPQLLDLLLHLVDRAGALVTKEELLDALWPNANVTENALTQAVSELRQALGDSASAPRFIKTIARRGYRFIGTIDTQNTSPALEGERSSMAGDASQTPTIAILDFVNLTGDRDSDWLSAGIAETVTGDLRTRAHVRIVDRWRVTDAVRRCDGSFQQIAQDVQAQLVVAGSIQHHGPHIRITARIIDVRTAEALADAKVDGPFDRIFELQDQIVIQLFTNLRIVAPRTEGSSVGRRDTPSLAAYRALVEGWLRLETLDVRELPAAVTHFEHAVKADPRYAQAYAGLATAEFALYEETRADLRPAQNRLERAIENARRAVALDDHLAEAHATLALILVSAWQTEEAAEAARLAVALEPANWRHLFRLGHATWGEERLRAASNMLALYPDFAYAHFQMAMVHVARGHLAEAETVLRQGAAVQDRQIGRGGRYPALGLHWLLGFVRLAQHDPADALHEFEAELAVAEPHRLYGREYAVEAHYGRGFAFLDMQHTQHAVVALRQALELAPDHVPTRLTLVHALRLCDDASAVDTELVKVDQTLTVLATTRPLESSFMRAGRLVGCARLDEAVELLRQLLDQAPPGFVGWSLPIDPLLRPLSGCQGFDRVRRGFIARASVKVSRPPIILETGER